LLPSLLGQPRELFRIDAHLDPLAHPLEPILDAGTTAPGCPALTAAPNAEALLAKATQRIIDR